MNHPATDLVVSWWVERFQRDDKRSEFAEALRRRFVETWDAMAKKATEAQVEPRLFIEVDYDPRDPLLSAVRDVGIECRGFMFSADGLFPQKTRMHVYPEEIETVEGYGAPIVRIWEAPK